MMSSALDSSLSQIYTAPESPRLEYTGMAAREVKAPSAKRDQNTCLPSRASATSESRAYFPPSEGERLSYTMRAVPSVTIILSSPAMSSRDITCPTASLERLSSAEREAEMTPAWLSRLLSFSEATRSREAAMG